jgi:hypothetical protein
VPHVSWFRDVGRKRMASEVVGLLWIAVLVPRHKGPTSRKEREKWGTPILLIAGDMGHPPTLLPRHETVVTFMPAD